MPPKPERDSVTSGSATIEYSVVRSARRKRTITLRVLRGEVEVLAPKRTPKRDIRSFVESKSQWVLDKLANPPLRAEVTPFGHGDTVPLLGLHPAGRGAVGDNQDSRSQPPRLFLRRD